MSAERLREAAEALRVSEASADPVMAPGVAMAVADWLDAEAVHAVKLLASGGALNFLISMSEPDESQPDAQSWRVKIGYQTVEQALAVADAILGADS